MNKDICEFVRRLTDNLPIEYPKAEIDISLIPKKIENTEDNRKTKICKRCNNQFKTYYANICDSCKQVIKEVRTKSLGLRFEILKRDNFRCVYCGRSAKDNTTLVIDHLHPVSRGGDERIENLVTSCYECNSGKSDKILKIEHINTIIPNNGLS